MSNQLGKLITGKFGTQINVEFTGHVKVFIDEGEGEEAVIHLHEQGTVELIEQLQTALEEYRKK